MDALLSQKQREVAPFHIPGHKRGAGVLEDFQRIVSRETLQYDLTELPGMTVTPVLCFCTVFWLLSASFEVTLSFWKRMAGFLQVLTTWQTRVDPLLSHKSWQLMSLVRIRHGTWSMEQALVSRRATFLTNTTGSRQRLLL